MTEKDLARHICNVVASTIVDENGGTTLGGITLSEKYRDRLYKAGGFNPTEVDKCAQALRHWVESVGYDKNGKFTIILSNTKMNC